MSDFSNTSSPPSCWCFEALPLRPDASSEGIRTSEDPPLPDPPSVSSQILLRRSGLRQPCSTTSSLLLSCDDWASGHLLGFHGWWLYLLPWTISSSLIPSLRESLQYYHFVFCYCLVVRAQTAPVRVLREDRSFGPQPFSSSTYFRILSSLDRRLSFRRKPRF